MVPNKNAFLFALFFLQVSYPPVTAKDPNGVSGNGTRYCAETPKDIRNSQVRNLKAYAFKIRLKNVNISTSEDRALETISSNNVKL